MVQAARASGLAATVILAALTFVSYSQAAPLASLELEERCVSSVSDACDFVLIRYVLSLVAISILLSSFVGSSKKSSPLVT
jgi:hypothetical protein